MVRVKLAKGGWKDLDEVAVKPEPFTRSNGTRMTEAEISAIAVGQPSSFVRRDGKEPARRKHNADEVWNAVQRLGTQVAAARELGVSQGAIQSSLQTYMRAHDLKGPLPGKMTPEQIKTNAQARAAKIVAERAAAHPPHVDEVAAAGPKTVPLPEQIADDDSNAPVVGKVANPALGTYIRAKPASVVEPAAVAAPPLADLLEQLEANLVGREALLELLAPFETELSDVQAALVLSAVIPGTINKLPLEVAQNAISRLKAHGFELVIRPA